MINVDLVAGIDYRSLPWKARYRPFIKCDQFIGA